MKGKKPAKLQKFSEHFHAQIPARREQSSTQEQLHPSTTQMNSLIYFILFFPPTSLHPSKSDSTSSTRGIHQAGFVWQLCQRKKGKKNPKTQPGLKALMKRGSN